MLKDEPLKALPPPDIKRPTLDRQDTNIETLAREREYKRNAEIEKQKQDREALTQLAGWQWGVIIFGIIMVGWALAATIVLSQIGSRYIFTMRSEGRAWYSKNGCAAYAKQVAQSVLVAAVDAQDAICDAMNYGLLIGSTDFAAMERALGPSFTSAHYLRHVDLVFSDASDVIAVGSTKLNDGQVTVTMKSDSDLCFLQGVFGCVTFDRPRTGLPLWAIPHATKLSKFTAQDGAELVWESEPHIDVKQSSFENNGQTTITVEVFPIYRLMFYCGNDDRRASGRVALHLAEFAENKLQDKTLGDQGRVYLVDSFGTILASKEPKDMLVSNSGSLSFRSIWSLDQPWAGKFRGPFAAVGEDGDPPADFQFLDEESNTEVALSCLEPPHNRFCVVVVAPELTPFQHTGFLSMCITSFFVAMLPWTFTCCSICFAFAKHQAQLRSSPHANPFRQDEFHIKEKRVSRFSQLMNTRFSNAGANRRFSAGVMGAVRSMASRLPTLRRPTRK